MVEIRQLQKGDAGLLLAFYNERGAASRRTFAPLGQMTTLDVCRGIVDDNTSEAGGGFSLVATDGTEIVGWGFIYKLGVSKPTLGLAVADAYHGQGIGSSLIEGVLDVARERGLSHVELTVVQDNEVAWRLYRKYGFVRYGECTGEDGLPYFQMRREIE
ncbi:MAG: GNAT family N-acetyltransferase [Anaerolineae bacterium]|nr:GNAT family N-acetyltransferase [Anaerolineae bacterium]